jgi:GTP cyclohydrolase IA
MTTRNRRKVTRFSDLQRIADKVVEAHKLNPWDAFLHIQVAYEELLKTKEIATKIDKEHLEKTPGRVVKALSELLEGYHQDPERILETSFTSGKYNQMIIVSDVKFTSLCVHHILPFAGTVHFAYIPDKRIVGLSKIPRLIECFSRRLQVQEELSEQIVDSFYKIVKPRGCAISIRGTHSCAAIRGVKKEGMYMTTTALRGIFEIDTSAKSEFLSSIKTNSY